MTERMEEETGRHCNEEQNEEKQPQDDHSTPRCIHAFSGCVARRPIVMACVVLSLSILLCMKGMSNFEIDTEVRNGRDEYSPEDSIITHRNDAVSLGRDALKQPLPLQSTQTFTSDEFSVNFLLSYRVRRSDNLFTDRYLNIIKNLEDEIRSLEEYPSFCWRNPVSPHDCVGIESILPRFLDQNQEVIGNISETLATVAASADNNYLSTYFSKDFSTSNPVSDVTRSFVRFGFPLQGYNNTDDRIVEQKEKSREFAVKCVKIVDKYVEQYEDEGFDIFYYGGNAAMGHMVDKILIEDGTFAFFSMLFVGIYIGVHSGSAFLAVGGMLHVVLSFPLAYFFLRDIFGIAFFDTMNTFLIYVLLGIGADDIIVFVDCFKQVGYISASMSTPLSMHQRVERSLMRSGKAMLVTSLTTCAAFVATATSGLMPVRQFGTFAALMIACNFVLCVTYFPALVVIWDVYLRNKYPCCFCFRSKRTATAKVGPAGDDTKKKSNETDTFDLDKFSRTERFIYATFSPFVLKYRFIFLAATFLWAIAMTVSATGMKLATDSPPPLPDDHPFYKVIQTIETRYQPSPSDPSSHVLNVFGLEQRVDRSGYSVFDSMSCDGPCGIVQFDTSFDPSSTAAQTHLVRLCNVTMQTQYILPGSTPNSCFMTSFKAWRKAQNLTFPIPSTDFNSEAERYLTTNADARRDFVDAGYVGYDASATTFRLGFILQSFRVGFRANKFYSLGELEPVQAYWEDFAATENAVAPPGVDRMFVTHEPRHSLFRNIDLQKNFKNGAIQGGLLSMLFATIIVLFATRNPWITGLTMSGVGLVVLSCLGMMVVYGWTLGVIESICLSLVVGFSVDFTVHFALSYMECEGNGKYALPKDRTRSTRMRHMLFEMGVSVIGGAITTLGASSFLMMCQLSFFSYFGIFIFTTVFASLFGSFVYFSSLVATIGPEDAQGEIVLPPKCFGAATSSKVGTDDGGSR